MAAWQVFIGHLLLATLVLSSKELSVIHKNKTIYILSLLPYPDPLFNPSWRDGPPISLALDMARDQINNQTELLPDYHIELIHDDSGCEYTTRAYKGFMRNAYYTDKNVVGVLGPACSKAAVALARLTSNKELAVVTLHGAGSPLLSNRTLYPYSLSSLGTRDLFSFVGVKLMQESNWTRVGVLFDESRLFYFSTVQSFQNKVTGNLSISFISAVYDMFIPLETIFNERLRVNFLFTPVGTTQRVLCLAWHRGMVYEAYQWIVASNFFDEVAKDVNFMYNGQTFNCSEKEMKESILNETLFLNFQLSAFNESAPSTYSKYSFREYDQIFRDKINEYNSQSVVLNRSNISYSIWSSYFYDSLWAWFVALDSLTKNHPNLDLSKYERGDTAFSDMIMKEFYNLEFEGVSGRIKFLNDSGSIIRALSVVQITNGRPKQVAYYDEREGFVQIHSYANISDSFFDQKQSVGVTTAAIFLVLALLQLAILVLLHVLTIKYRSHPSVKASSVKLNQLLYIGCYIFILTLLLFTIRELSDFTDYTALIVCNLGWAWLLPMSFTLTFGTVAVRTWRLYRIFTHYLNPGRFIGDYYLMAFVLMLLLVDIVIGTVWMAVDPQRIEYFVFTSLRGGAKFQILERNCVSENAGVIYAVVFGVRILLIIAVLVLTILTRNIKNQTFTTVTLQILVYLFSPVMVIGFGIFYVSRFFNPSSSLSTIILLITLNLILFLFITLVCLSPLMPLFREVFSKLSSRKGRNRKMS